MTEVTLGVAAAMRRLLGKRDSIGKESASSYVGVVRRGRFSMADDADDSEGTELVLSNVEQAAKAVIDEHEKLKLDRQQSQALVESLLAPALPNKALRTAARDHRKKVTSR